MGMVDWRCVVVRDWSWCLASLTSSLSWVPKVALDEELSWLA